MNNLISSCRLESVQVRGGYTLFECMTWEKPRVDELAAWQVALGYDPRGYGFPYEIHTEKIAEQFRTTWKCFNSCD